MGNALHNSWDDSQKNLYGLQTIFSEAAAIAFGTVLAQYCVAEWIWKSKTKDNPNSQTFLVALLMFWVIWTLVANSSLLSAWGTPSNELRAYYIATPILAFCGFFLNLIFSSLWNCAWNRNDSRDVEDDASLTASYSVSPLLEDETVPPSQSTTDVEAPVRPEPLPAKAKVTVDYINNIKIFLTHMVIIHHCAADFGGLWPGLTWMTRDSGNWGTTVLNIFLGCNASYFMNLFFFYSGFFVPKSFDKKGLYDFLFDRVKRLGIPYVVYTFFLGPYVYTGFMHLFFQTPFPSGTNNYGVAWFMNQLMIFSSVYAFVCGKNWSPKVKCPSLIGFFLIGSVVGLFTGILTVFFPGGNFFGVPSFWQDYLSYPLYFFGGAVAQRNGWMDAIKEKSRVAIYTWMILTWFIVYVVIGLLHDKGKLDGVAYLLLQGIVWKGIFSMAISLAVSVFFMDYVNKKYFCTQFYSKSMYTAYIIQYTFPVLVGLKCLFVILDSTGNVAYDDPSNPSVNNMYITNSNLIFPGWLLVSTIALIIDWPLAYAIQAIPGFSQVL